MQCSLIDFFVSSSSCFIFSPFCACFLVQLYITIRLTLCQAFLEKKMKNFHAKDIPHKSAGCLTLLLHFNDNILFCGICGKL